MNRSTRLGYMCPTEATEMVHVAHYFGAAAVEAHQARLSDSLSFRCSNDPLTPAQLEEACAENDDVEALIQDLAVGAAAPVGEPVISAAAAAGLP